MIPGTLVWHSPWAFLLLAAALPLLVALALLERRRSAALRFPLTGLLRAGPRGLAGLWWFPWALRGFAVLCAVIALDLSTSMRAADFKPVDRITVAKEVLKDFIGRRTSDRIGLVVFAGDAYTQAPLTLDYGILRTLVDQLQIGVIEDGTAIGNAIATAVNRLRESDAKSKVIILITDGDSNAGQISPREAAGLAKAMGVRVFPILVGKGGVVPYPVGVDLLGQTVYQPMPFAVNPELLREIAQLTGGAYANAGDKQELERGLQAVLDRMEKTRIFETTASSRVVELFPRLLGPAFWLAAAGLLLGLTRWRSFP